MKPSTTEKQPDCASFASRMTLRVLMIRFVVAGVHLFGEYTTRQLMALANRGHEVTYLIARTQQSRMSTRNTSNFRLDTVLLRKNTPVLSLILFELMAFWRAMASIFRYDALILDVYSLPLLFPALVISRLRRPSLALFLRVESNPVETGGLLRSMGLSVLYALSIRLASAFFGKIFFISPMLAQLYSRQFGISPEKVAVWPSSVDMAVFDPRSVTSVDRLRRELRLSGRLGVLYHGVLTRGRGIMELLEAFRILSDRHVKATLVLLGYGPLREKVIEEIQANHLEGVVRACGPVDYSEVPRYISACDVEINAVPDHPWWRYQCFVKTLECLAMNKPLIVSDIPAHRWIAGDAPVVLYLKGTSAREIADGVLAFMRSEKELNPSLGREIASRFSAERIAKTLEDQILSATQYS